MTTTAREPLVQRRLDAHKGSGVAWVFFAFVFGTTLSNVTSKMAFNAFSSSFSFVLQQLQLLVYSTACFAMLTLRYRRGGGARASARSIGVDNKNRIRKIEIYLKSIRTK